MNPLAERACFPQVVIGHGDGPIALRGAGTSSGGLTQTPPASTISGPHRGDTCCKACLCDSGPAFTVTETQVRKTPSWSRSWANFSLL